MINTFIDTNIALDYMFSSRPEHNKAVKLLSKFEIEGIAVYLAQHSFNDIYFHLKKWDKANNPSKTTAQIGKFLRFYLDELFYYFTIVGADHVDTKIALKLNKKHPDFEDNLIFAIAERVNVDTIVTNDRQFLKAFPGKTKTYTDFGL